MWEIFHSIGTFDKLKKKGSLQHYKKKLQKYQEHEADVLIDMGIVCFNDERYDESLKYLKDARLGYFKLNNKEGEAFVFDLIGDVYLSMREIDKALKYYKDSFEVYASVRSPMKLDLIEKIKEVEAIKEAIELTNKEDIELIEEVVEEDAEEYESITIIEESPKNESRCHLNYEKVVLKLENVLNIIKKEYGVKEISKEEYEAGYIRKFIMDTHNSDDTKKKLGTILVMGNYLMKEEKVYTALKNFKAAFHVAQKIEDKKGEAISLLLIGVAYYVLSSEDKIYDIFKKSIELFKNLGDKKLESVAMDLINTLYAEDTCPSDNLSISKA
ncbi:tetratricopeptide repeat protein [Methanobacterium oryzae]|uniref:tetratricopeptide repeat protein n=1 Tax=Methanobacterium oryzae TaxID=69540 RepID=UPI003D22AE35